MLAGRRTLPDSSFSLRPGISSETVSEKVTGAQVAACETQLGSGSRPSAWTNANGARVAKAMTNFDFMLCIS